MNGIGQLIEERRSHLGLSRREVGDAIGVSAQTILNLERNPDYNLGLRLLRKLEGVLQVEFTISMKEAKAMSDTIVMGNDELILHIRKHYDCGYRNPYLGRRIWEWLDSHAGGEQLDGRHPAPWDKDGPAVSPTGLPKDGVHFRFRRSALPDLYAFLAQLGSEGPVDGS